MSDVWRAQIYCPGKGYGKILADNGKNSGSQSSRRVNISLENCTSIPGTQVN
jgi:hypothetical protein